MLKYIYKIVGLFMVFVGALFFFGSRVQSEIYEEGTTSYMGKESLPYMTLTTQGITVNTLYGYNGPLDEDIVRESITPLNEEKKLHLSIAGGSSSIIKLKYEVVDKDSGEVLFSDEVNSLNENTKELDLFFDYGFATSTEYILSLTATTEQGRRVHYFTRLKYYSQDSNLAKKMQFAKQFHEDTFSKGNVEKVAKFLETDGTAEDNTLARVTIKSSSDLVTWGKMAPRKVTEPVPIIKEYNMETACFQFNYFVEAETSSGKEVYRVNEFYRVRYASGMAYLLNFERTLESQFDVKLTNVQRSQIKVGITNDTDMDILSYGDRKKVFFARGGNVYQYDMDKKENKITKVYSALSENADDFYRVNASQDIRLLKVDDAGNLYFAAYGYFSRGQYEGKVAIVLYEYVPESGQLVELVYLPMDTTYQQLKQDFNEYGYVSEKNNYYFVVADVVYSYNMETRRLLKLAENVTEDSFRIMKKSHCFVWSSSLETGYGTELTIFDLETEKKIIITSETEEEYIRLLGVINEDVVYGFVNKGDITVDSTGETIVPCKNLVIANKEGTVSKAYDAQGKYITKVKVQGNVMTLSRAKKVGKSFRKISNDSILNQTESTSSAYSLKARMTSSLLTEWYIGFPLNFTMESVPSYEVAEDMVISGGRSVHLDMPKMSKYYVYALGKITGAYENAAVAIAHADEQMGVVVSSSHRVIWERSGSFLMNSVGGLEMQKQTESISNYGACAYMILRANHFTVSGEKLSKKNSVYEMMKTYMDETVNLTGGTLEQVLYFVSNNKYVVGVLGDSTAVVISGYDTKTITYYEPSTGKVKTASRKAMEKAFKAAGNVFISYTNAFSTGKDE